MKKFHRTDFILWLLPVYILVAYWRVFLVILAFLAGIAAACGQMVITSGGTYSGTWYSGVEVRTTQNVTITNSTIGQSGATGGDWGLKTTVAGANLTVTNTWFQGGTNVPSYGGGFHAWKCANLAVENCHFEADGNWALLVEGPGSTTAAITIYLNDFVDALYGVQINNNQNDPNILISNNRFTQSTSYQHSDQIGIINSSGTGNPAGAIEIQNNLILANPDAPDLNMPPNIHTAASIQAPDSGSYWIETHDNTILNGNRVGISGVFNDNGTSSVHNNYVLGIGQNNPADWSDGIDFTTQQGTCYSNTCGWWDAYFLQVRNFYPEGSSGNTALGKASITLAHEQNKVSAWNSSNMNCGYLYPPTFYYPAAGDFPP